MGLLRYGEEGEEEAPQQKSRKGKVKEKESLAANANKRQRAKTQHPQPDAPQESKQLTNYPDYDLQGVKKPVA